MPPRRNSRKKATPQKQAKEGTDVADTEGNSAECSEAAGNEAVVSDVKNEIADGDQNIEETTEHSNSPEEEKSEIPDVNQQDDSKMTLENVNNGSMDLPYKVKVSHLPATYVLKQFKHYIEVTFNISIPNIISPANNSPWLLIPFATKEEQENLIKLLHNHVWKKKALRAIAFHALEPVKRGLEDNENDNKKLKLDENLVLTLEEEILSESLPLYSVPYEEQNRFTIQDVELLSNKLHAFMCVRNPALAGWAEAMCEKNNGFIYKIEPLKPSPILEGYRNKCKFRIGINADGEITVGFCLNDNENKILGVQPGDKLIHLPDSMKYAAKKFEEFIRTSGKEQYDKKKRSGFWDHIIIRVAPGGELMLVVVMYHNSLPDEEITNIKKDVKEFFTNGEGKDCKLFSLYFQVMNDKPPMLLPDKLELLMGEPSFEENICGLRFHVGPFSILSVNSPSAENIYKSIIELAEPTPESTIIDICSGTGGIAFTIAHLCKQVIAIESQEDNVNDALKTKKLNNIQNVEFIKAKVEDALSGIFAKLGDSPIIPIIDPPRQGLVQKAISILRSNKGINKLVYVCSNSKMGVKNFLDLCASSDKKEGTFGNPLNVEFAGLPFLPVKAVPVDVAPYTVNNTIIILFERIDPSTFPPAKNPPPVPLKKPQAQKDEKKKPRKGQGSKRGGRAFFRQQGKRGRGRKFPGQGGRGGAIGGLGGRGGRFAGNPKRGGMGFNNQNRMGRFPPPLMRPVDPALSLVAKYERRIAELEQQDRAFKAGLTMGLQALGSRTSGGPGHGPGPGPGGDFGNFGNSNNNSFRNMGYFPQNESFGGFNKDSFGQFDRGDRNAWQRNNNPGRNNFGASGNVGNIGNMSNMSSMGSMGNMGNMSNMSNMNNMNNMSNMNNMNNMNPMNNMNSMSNMSSMGNNMGNGFGGGGNSGGGNNFGGNFGGGGGGAGVGGFNSFGGNSNFGNFGGAGGGSFNSNFGGGNNFRNYQGNKNRRQC